MPLHLSYLLYGIVHFVGEDALVHNIFVRVSILAGLNSQALQVEKLYRIFVGLDRWRLET